MLNILMLFSLLTGSVPTGAEAQPEPVIILPPGDATFAEVLAAREVQRYFYLRTGHVLPIHEATEIPLKVRRPIVIARKDRFLVKALARAKDPGLSRDLASLEEQQYLLKSIDGPSRTVLMNVGGESIEKIEVKSMIVHGGPVFLIVGGDDIGTLYGAYRLAERLGIRFYLHGDVIPDEKVDLGFITDTLLPELDDRGAPLFNLRGIQPFHDFPEGPDWWNLDDYKAILSQLPKLGMNFFGLHTYPEGHPNAEPTVWIGLPDEIGEGCSVKAAYPSSYQNTLRGNWGYIRTPTGSFHSGASQLFERDAFGSEVMLDRCPQPESEEDSIDVFHRAGKLLNAAFEHAHRLGVKTCVGTETPLTVPRKVQERLAAAGKDPASLDVIGALYEGMFKRAAQAYPLDYYWFWTPEGWTWSGVAEEQVKKTIDDMKIAVEAAKKVNAPFQLATCGWVLGPESNRALFDEVLPPDMPVSCINRQVGNTPVDAGFANVKHRPKWAIPWLEDDPGLTSPQLWVGRMRRDAADARRYGCTGLMGIHWRTRVLGPTTSALAKAAWDQDPWNKTPNTPAIPPKEEGPRGGSAAAFPNNPIADTKDEILYQTVRYNMAAYRFEVPDGAYQVTLKFCEPHYNESGKRVFSVKLEGRQVIEGLDLFARVGKNKALDYTFPGIEVADGWLDVDFVYEVEFPSIAAIVIEGASAGRKINCGGPAHKDFRADWPVPIPERGYLPSSDFYADWAGSQFGRAAGAKAAKIFEKMDGNLPRSSHWIGGPGGMKPDPRPWSDVQKEYAFVDELEALRPLVKGAGNLERFDYWLNTFRGMRAQSKASGLWAVYNKAMEEVGVEKDESLKTVLALKGALPARIELVAAVREAFARLLEIVSNPGELGTVANWEQHILPSLLLKPGEELEKILGQPLPGEARLEKDYRGPARIIVPTQLLSIDEGEVLTLKVIVLAKEAVREGAVFWRPLGAGVYGQAPLKHVARGVYTVKFPPDGASGSALEYNVKVVLDGGEVLIHPATAPALNQTMVVAPAVK